MSAPPAPHPGHEDQSLQLPLLGLYADLEAGRGSVALPDEFLGASAAVQLEILGDWQRGLSATRQRALRQLYTDLARTSPAALNPEQQMALFRTTCHSLGIEVPADFTAPDAGV